jgi:hypothetical protein
MTGYKPVGSVEHGRRFLNILHEAGGVYVPEYVGRTRYTTDTLEKPLRSWTKQALLTLRRRRPRHVDVIVTVDMERAAWPNQPAPTRPWASTDISITVESSHFQSEAHLNEFVALGDQLYDFLSPYHGFVMLQWMPGLFGVPMPDAGLPGWGWTTWLGPEYDGLVNITPSSLITVRMMPDGGRVIQLPYPTDASAQQPDPVCLEAYRHVLQQIDPTLFQSRPRPDLSAVRQRATRVPPKFRFLEAGSPREVSQAAPESGRRRQKVLESVGTEATGRLGELMALALESAITFMSDGALAPFVFADTDGKRSLLRNPLVTTTADLGLLWVTLQPLLPSADAYAAVYTERLAIQGATTDTIVVDGEEKDRADGVRIVQRYRRRRRPTRIELIGDPLRLR